MKREPAMFLAGVLVATLAACHQDQKASGHGIASGEILPGSVSDAMLPYDAVKSKAPLAPADTVTQAAPMAVPSPDRPAAATAESAASDAEGQ